MADPAPNLRIVVIPPSEEKGPSREATATETSTVTFCSVDSMLDSDDFKDPDCSISEEESAEVSVDVGTQVPSERERNEEEEVFRDRTAGNCFERCMRPLASFNESKYMLIFQFLLLAIPISAGFMGAKYLDKCPLSSETPVFLFMMGIAGTIVIICRILLMSQKILLPTHREWQVLRVIIIVGNLAIIVCLATEMFSFFRTVPSFEIGSAHYCHKVFYKYTYWTNWTCLVVITFLLLLQLPNCSVVHLQDDETL